MGVLRIEEIESFLNQTVSIGVPHLILEGQLFFHYGILKYVDSEEIQIQTKDGFRRIPIKNIVAIRKDSRRDVFDY